MIMRVKGGEHVILTNTLKLISISCELTGYRNEQKLKRLLQLSNSRSCKRKVSLIFFNYYFVHRYETCVVSF